MGDEAQVVLVDAQPEGVGRDDRLQLVGHEAFLRLPPLGRGHLAVIQTHVEPVGVLLVDPFGFLHGGDVDHSDAVLLAQLPFDEGVLDSIVHRAPDLEAEIGACKAGDLHEGILHPELADNVGLHLGRGGRSQGEHRRPLQPAGDVAEGEIVGTEVVSPLAHTVGFVDHEETDGAPDQVLEKRAVLEPFGCEVQDLALAFADHAVCLTRFRGVEVRVHGDRLYAVGEELVVLILHQCDERRDNDRQPFEHHCRELVDERLAAAGRHHDECVATLSRA
jgi:hypothetical protein